ncbi:MAG: VOC family protein [Pseudomonadota bacterium]
MNGKARIASMIAAACSVAALSACGANVEARADQENQEPTTIADNSINYIEFPLVDAEATKTFYAAAFGWTFTDWGPDYVSFEGAGVAGGFNGAEAAAGVVPRQPGVLVVLYAADLERALDSVKAAGGEIVKPIFPFTGGRRFHFKDPNGNELAIWSEDPNAETDD